MSLNMYRVLHQMTFGGIPFLVSMNEQNLSSFSGFENNSHEKAKTKLESMQIAAKQKKKAAEQAVLEAFEAENNVEVVELEIEVAKRKGCIEETFWRFPHIGEQIFEELDETSLFKCLEINKWWQKIVNEKKIRQINQLEKYTYIKSSILKKELGNTDFEIIHKLANYSIKVYKKVIIDGMNSNGISHDNNGCAKQQEEILRYLFEKKHRNNIQHLLTKLMLKYTMKKTLNEIQPLIQNGDFALLQIFLGTLKEKKHHDFLMEMFKRIHLRWSNGRYPGSRDGEEVLDAILKLYPFLQRQIYSKGGNFFCNFEQQN